MGSWSRAMSDYWCNAAYFWDRVIVDNDSNRYQPLLQGRQAPPLR